MRIAVIGHVEHVTIAAVPALPDPGEIVHLGETWVIGGGGGGIAFFQIVNSNAEVHLFTAVGTDDAALDVYDAVRRTGATVHAAVRFGVPHTRDLVLVTPAPERTIFVVGEPLHPRIDDRLSWEVLATCDAVYFTGQDPETLVAARAAKVLVVTARRAEALAKSGVQADVVVGSRNDPREASTLSDYVVPPKALVMTDGAAGGRVMTADAEVTFAAPAIDFALAGAYGAGDSFAGALTWYVARGLPVVEACERAAQHGAAVLRGVNPIEHQRRLD
jgi:ribokinase